MELIKNKFITEYISSKEYGFYTKESYDFFNIFFKNKENLIKVIDPSGKYHDKEREKAFLYSYFNSLLFFYSVYCDSNDIIRSSNNNEFVSFPLQDGTHYVLLKRNSVESFDKPYRFYKLYSKDDKYFTNHPYMKGTYINLKNYEGYKINDIMPYNEKVIFDVINHGFREEHRTIKEGKTPLFNGYINFYYPYDDELKMNIFESVAYEYKQHIKNKKPLIHYINESGRKTAAMEINIPLDFDSKEIDYKLMLIFDYNKEKKYYEPKTIVNHQAVYTKALNFEGFDTPILSDNYLKEMQNTNKLIDKIYIENKENIKRNDFERS